MNFCDVITQIYRSGKVKSASKEHSSVNKKMSKLRIKHCKIKKSVKNKKKSVVNPAGVLYHMVLY